jgi:hypothetical protein
LKVSSIFAENTVMINVTIGKSKPQEKPFPKLMTAFDGNLIAIFYRPKIGTILYVEHETDFYKVGVFLNDWEMHGFTDYNEPITLQNA